MWTDEELEVMLYALEHAGEQIHLRGDEFEDSFRSAHTSLSLRVAEELVRRERLR